MKSLYILLLALAVSAASCRTKDGEPGPAGESALNKQGNISGTITYTDASNNSVSAPFSYQYYESLEENEFVYETFSQSAGYYQLNFARRDVKDVNNRISFNVQGNTTNDIESAPSYTNVNFTFITLVNNDIVAFTDESIDVTNVVLDHTTGRVTFNFSGTVYDIDDNEATVSGTADVTLNRLRQSIAL